MKLLIAEDNERLLSTLVRVLEREGYTVDGVNNGALALDYLRASDYDGLLLDIMMPEVDGLEVLRTARAEGFTCFAISTTCLS